VPGVAGGVEVTACRDCGLLYDDAWPGDAMTDDATWLAMGDVPGVLCANCMTRRILSRVPRAVAVWMVPMDGGAPTLDTGRPVTIAGTPRDGT